MTPNELRRALPKIERVPFSTCWFWIGDTDGYGYGRLKLDGKAAIRGRAHRLMYEHYVGPIPTGLEIDHLCRVRCCVNPAHLEPVTTKVNVLRGESVVARNAVKTHCVRGHEFTPENTYRKKLGRECVACMGVLGRARRRRAGQRVGVR